jgi:HK97 family phage prohead protease
LNRGAGAVPLLWQHEAGRPIGRIEYLREDKRGLRVIGRLVDKRAAALLKDGAVGGLSFGYRVRDAKGEQPRELTDLELVEVSPCDLPDAAEGAGARGGVRYLAIAIRPAAPR